MIKQIKGVLVPALLAILFIVLTGYFAFSNTSMQGLQHFCFMFHLFPFGVGFSGGDTVQVLAYYLVLWIVLTFLFLGIKAFLKPLILTKKNS